MNIPLKLKYRNPNQKRLRRPFDPEGGTLIFKAGRFGASPVSGVEKKKVVSIRPRRRAYGPF